jgi:hypothetical protein
VKRIAIRIILILLLAAGMAAWWQRDNLRASWNQLRGITFEKQEAPHPRPDDYRTLVEDAARWRKDLAKRYRKASTKAERDQILAETRTFLEVLLPSMMRCWLGTPWDFNGTAECPGDGKIACGYFVATVLRDAGFRIDRYKLAKQPSQKIIRTFLPRKAFIFRVGVPYEKFAAEARTFEPGVHIIGLDTHVGFLVVRNGSFRFIHSSGSHPWCVVDEPKSKAAALARSNYRVLGNITSDPEVLRRWLLEKPFPVGKR